MVLLAPPNMADKLAVPLIVFVLPPKIADELPPFELFAPPTTTAQQFDTVLLYPAPRNPYLAPTIQPEYPPTNVAQSEYFKQLDCPPPIKLPIQYPAPIALPPQIVLLDPPTITLLLSAQ